MKKQTLRYAATIAIIGVAALKFATPALANLDEAKKDGIKSSTTGLCWNSGSQCTK